MDNFKTEVQFLLFKYNFDFWKDYFRQFVVLVIPNNRFIKEHPIFYMGYLVDIIFVTLNPNLSAYYLQKTKYQAFFTA